MKKHITVVRRRIQPVVVRKTADQTVTNSTTLVNDTHLLYAIGANEEWVFRLDALFSSHASQDLKHTFTAPSGATFYWGVIGEIPYVRTSAEARITQGQGASATPNGVHLAWGIIKNGSTAGNLQWQFAQNAAAANDTIVFTGSALILHQIT